MAAVLEMAGIDKSFGGVHALQAVDFDLHAGEVHALVGQNGAGKSTLIKVLAGAILPDAGSIHIDGHPVSLSSPADALRLGVGTVYQDPLVYPELTVTENIFMGRELRTRLGTIDKARQVQRVRALLQDLEVAAQLATAPIGSLSVALRQLALIAKALSWDAKIIIFDEPTAILTQREAETLFGIIRKLRARGVGIIYISHRLEEIFSLADRVTVLKDGARKGTWRVPTAAGVPVSEDAREALTIAHLIEVMAGHALLESVTRQGGRAAEPALAVRHLSLPGAYRDISFALYPGEIVGFFGLVGAGRSEVARAIFGLEPAREGEIALHGRVVRLTAPLQALRLGIAYLPEDRKGQGLFGNLTVRYNTAVSVLRRLTTLRFVVQQKKEASVAEEYVRRLSIKTPSTAVKVATLSGGNQQKIVIAKWLAARPRIFLLDEPTAGIDVAAKQEIHNLIVSLAHEGVAIMLISSELPEILKLSDRVITMHEGRLTGEFPRDTPANVVLSAAMGAGTAEVNDASA